MTRSHCQAWFRRNKNHQVWVVVFPFLLNVRAVRDLFLKIKTADVNLSPLSSNPTSNIQSTEQQSSHKKNTVRLKGLIFLSGSQANIVWQSLCSHRWRHGGAQRPRATSFDNSERCKLSRRDTVIIGIAFTLLKLWLEDITIWAECLVRSTRRCSAQ